MLNHIVLMGRLTKDPELRRTNSGTSVASFTLAVDRDFKNQDGTKETDFIDIVVWKNSAEFVAKNFSKGRMAAVEGRLQIRKWQDKEGNNRYQPEVVASGVFFADSKKDSGISSTPPEDRPYVGGGRRANDAEMAQSLTMLDDDDKDLPF